MKKKTFKKLAILLIAGILLFIYIKKIKSPKPITDPNTIFSIPQLKKDLSKTKSILFRWHPSIGYTNSTFESHFDTLYHSIQEGMKLSDFYILMNRLVSKLNCGHTCVLFPEKCWGNINNYHKFFPFRLYFKEHQGYVVKSYGTTPSIQPGTRILSVNKKSMAEIVDNFLDIYSGDGNNLTFKYQRMNTLGIGLFPGYKEFPESYDIEYILPTETRVRKTRVKAVESNRIPYLRWEIFYEDSPEKLFDSKIIDSFSTAILNVRTFDMIPGFKYQGFFKSFFKNISEKNIDNLIIDVRNNDGGDPYVASDLLSYIIPSPITYFRSNVYGYSDLKKPLKPAKIGFKGGLYILINGGCYSTTGHFLSLLKFHKIGLIIGEESGGSYLCYGCNDDYVLPESRLRLMYTRCTFATDVYGLPPDRGIFPDLEIKPSIDDIVAGKDPVLSHAFKLIKEKGTEPES